MPNLSRKQELLESFHATFYCFFLNNVTVRLRVGEKNPKLSNWLSANNITRWAFLTSFNPGAKLCSNSYNKASYLDLLDLAKQKQWLFFKAEAQPDHQNWPVEKGIVVFDQKSIEVKKIALYFNQLAFVVGAINSAARLVWT
tara:strand:+ start:76 stop:501 length:426 start_codon:yes stop_codon:yes gene_type:complete